MYQALQVLSVLLAAIAMGLTLAHVLERPGKVRLGRAAYLTVQSIYAPGFAIGGLAEPLVILTMFILVVATESDRALFWPTVIALAFFVLAHAVFWTVVQPVNRFWKTARQANDWEAPYPAIGAGQSPVEEWTVMRDRWESGHLIRAILHAVGLLFLAGAVTS